MIAFYAEVPLNRFSKELRFIRVSLGGEVDFKVMDGFEVDLEDEFTLLLVNVKGLGGGGQGR